MYNEVLNHINTSDELRRSTESKLLRYKQRYQHALPLDGNGIAEKRRIGHEIDDIVNGIVLLNIADELAWLLFLDAQDNESIDMFLNLIHVKGTHEFNKKLNTMIMLYADSSGYFLGQNSRN